MIEVLGTSRKPDVTFRKNGAIDISAWVSKRLGLRSGDTIGVAYDGNDYLLFVRAKREQIIGRHHAVCYATNRGSHNHRCHSTALCRKVLHLAGARDIARLPVGEFREIEGHPAFVLIIRNNLADKI